MHRLLLDANFLVLPFQHGVRLFDEFDRLLPGRYEVCVLNRAYNEALQLDDGRYRQRVERLVSEHPVEVIEVDAAGSVDEVLVSLAGEYVVCTNDTAVRQELRDRELPHIFLRQQSHLEAAFLPEV